MSVTVCVSGSAVLMASDNHLLKEQAQQRRQQQASQTNVNAADKPLFGPPIQVWLAFWLLVDL